MKNHTHISFTLLSLFLLLCSSCSNDLNMVDFEGEKASLPRGLIVESGLGEALSVIEVKTYNSTDKELVVEGFIGGRKRPFTKTVRYLFLEITPLKHAMKKMMIIVRHRGMYAVRTGKK